jgi:hypothetical protein
MMCLTTDELTNMNILVEVFSKLGPIERIWALSKLSSDHKKLVIKERTHKESKPILDNFKLVAYFFGCKIFQNKEKIYVSCPK